MRYACATQTIGTPVVLAHTLCMNRVINCMNFKGIGEDVPALPKTWK